MTDPTAIDLEVHSRADLAAFVRRLRDDLARHPDNWENGDLGSFLEAAAGWIDDMDGFYENRGETVPEHPDWRTVAQIFAAAKVYE